MTNVANAIPVAWGAAGAVFLPTTDQGVMVGVSLSRVSAWRATSVTSDARGMFLRPA
ncbi:MAG: hypothetical protein JO100_08790 [Pseudonocardia sp.]|nr:hypothetical protein [Pseudonocardia sp.]